MSFIDLNQINVNKYVEKKNGLSYLSWTYAWTEFKKVYPDADYEVLRDKDGRPYFGDDDLGYICMTKVTANNETHEMWLPVMDGANNAKKSKPYTVKTKYREFDVSAATMFDINKTIMRCLTKNIAMFGLGLYLYAGEDLPESMVLNQVREIFLEIQDSEPDYLERFLNEQKLEPAKFGNLSDNELSVILDKLTNLKSEINI